MASVICLGASLVQAEEPPAVAREFRGAWVATVHNVDWPSRRDLSTEEQKRELLAILDKCVELNLNAVIFQVRPAADAVYASKLEPWSEYLTGQMGRAPKPFYDPLKFVIEESHRRGLQLHAWFNPYRVRMTDAKIKPARNHSSVTRKKIVREYGKFKWFDPGEPAAVDHFIAVLKDVVKRYDIDGVHIDDYFYPYPENDEDDKPILFPDDKTYERAVAAGEKLNRDDWRRQNVNKLVERMYAEVKKLKPWVLVGISPFGIWKPDHPPGVKGFDQYSSLYADARKWQQEGWVDYFTPQLYWLVESKEQSYPQLLGWWHEQNVKGRHLWPGNFTSKIGRKPEPPKKKKKENGKKHEQKKNEKKTDDTERKDGDTEDEKKENEKKKDEKPPERVWVADDVVKQIEATRAQQGATGNVHFSMKALVRNFDGVTDKLKAGLYAEPALVPETAWLGGEAPAKPEVSARPCREGVQIDMKIPRGKPPWQWVVRVRTPDGWTTDFVPGTEKRHMVPSADAKNAKEVIVSAVSRLGQEGEAARVEL
jgi:uncharacterized lipoprotein YddW (UPF0748 family)